jgi:hypothetical protein
LGVGDPNYGAIQEAEPLNLLPVSKSEANLMGKVGIFLEVYFHILRKIGGNCTCYFIQKLHF